MDVPQVNLSGIKLKEIKFTNNRHPGYLNTVIAMVGNDFLLPPRCVVSMGAFFLLSVPESGCFKLTFLKLILAK